MVLDHKANHVAYFWASLHSKAEFLGLSVRRNLYFKLNSGSNSTDVNPSLLCFCLRLIWRVSLLWTQMLLLMRRYHRVPRLLPLMWPKPANSPRSAPQQLLSMIWPPHTGRDAHRHHLWKRWSHFWVIVLCSLYSAMVWLEGFLLDGQYATLTFSSLCTLAFLTGIFHMMKINGCSSVGNVLLSVKKPFGDKHLLTSHDALICFFFRRLCTLYPFIKMKAWSIRNRLTHYSSMINTEEVKTQSMDYSL